MEIKFKWLVAFAIVNYKIFFESKGAKIVIYLSENGEIALCYFQKLLRFH